MASQWYLESTKAPGLRFRIMHLEKESRRAQLLGDTGVPFERVLTDDVLEKYGFQVVRVAEEACVSSS